MTKPEFSGTILGLRTLRLSILRLVMGQNGQDLVEYALTAAMIAVAAGAIFPSTIAPDISTIMSKIVCTLNAS